MSERGEDVVAVERPQLVCDRLHHFRAAVADLAEPQAAHCIEVRAPLVVPEGRALGAGDVDELVLGCRGVGERMEERTRHETSLPRF